LADWELIIRTVGSSLEQHGDELAQKLETELFPDGVPENLTIAMILSAARDYLDRRLADARTKEAALAEERSDDEPARGARDHAEDECKDKLFSVGGLVTGAYGEAFAEQMGLAGRMPEDVDMLVQKAETAAGLLEKASPGTPRAGDPLDLAKLAGELRIVAARERAGLAGVQREKREENDALHARDVSFAALARGYSGVADVTVGVCVLAGRDDVADRVRPTWRRKSGRPEPGDVKPNATNTEATDTEATDTEAT
jgi:hypothetical protein